MPTFPKVAIIYLSFNPEPYIDDVISALKKITYPKGQLEFVVVDNPHPEFGSSAWFLNNTLSPLSGTVLPHVTILVQEKNVGFSRGNNVGIQWAIEHNFDYVFFHNNDGFVTSACLEPLVNAMESDKTVGTAQPLIMLYPETNLVNTSGNALHYLMIGYCNDFRTSKDNIHLPAISETGYGSGAALLMRVNLLKKFGVWDADFWLYHEDIEYCLRLKSLGYKSILVKDSIFYHKYNFSRNSEKFYYIERNRFGVILMFYKLPTLILLAPISLALEIGMLLFAWRGGWLSAKLKAYSYWLHPKNWKLWLKKRSTIQSMRTVGDSSLLRGMVGEVHFEEKSIANPLLTHIGNPLMAAYGWVLKKIIVW